MGFIGQESLSKIEVYLQWEFFTLVMGVLLIEFLFYKQFLKSISEKRHENLKARFKSTSYLLFVSIVLGGLHYLLKQNQLFWTDVIAYISFAFLSIVFIKISQIIAYLYLFFKNISQGIPRLIVNLLTVVLSLVVVSFIASEIFSVRLAAMLATSAVFSLVLGLALQDTLGNLFSGVVMQVGQPYRIGDWVEITIDSQKKYLGQVYEVTWRATFINTFSDECVMIPNKTMAQGQIVNFSQQIKPHRESVVLKLDLPENIDSLISILKDIVHSNEFVLKNPEARVLLTEINESWAIVKIFYSISDFSMRYRIMDSIHQNIIKENYKGTIRLAYQKMKLISHHDG